MLRRAGRPAVELFEPSRTAYVRLFSRYGRSSATRANSEAGTATQSFMTTPCWTTGSVRYFFMKATRSSSGSRSRRSPVGERYVNILPFVDVYGIVAPLRSMLGFDASSVW